VKKLLNELYQFSNQGAYTLDKELSKSSMIYHYYNEIIRFWSKINFIVKKNLRFIDQTYKLDQKELPIYFYATYRILWENCSISSILEDLGYKYIDRNEIEKYDKLKSFLKKLNTFSLSIALKGKEIVEKISIEQAIPTFFINKLLNFMNFRFLKENIDAMNDSTIKDYTLWFNLKKIEKDNRYNFNLIKKELNEKGINFFKDPHIPYLFHIKNKKEITRSKWNKNGYLIFQDKASVAVIEILSPNDYDFVYDMCAGPGMKTSLVAQISNNNLKIIAVEFNEKRVKEIKKLLKKFNVNISSLLNADSINPPFNNKIKFDKILLDAPCSGSGTFLSNPELKWRQNSKFLSQNVLLQEKLLNSAIKLLKQGGILVYSTCSLYAEEGEYQIEKILNDLIPLELPDWLTPGYIINNKKIPGTGRLFPSIHRTQGFFIAKLKKKNKS